MTAMGDTLRDVLRQLDGECPGLFAGRRGRCDRAWPGCLDRWLDDNPTAGADWAEERGPLPTCHRRRVKEFAPWPTATRWPNASAQRRS